MRIGFGAEYEAGADALPLLGLAMTTLAMTYLAVNFLLAVGSNGFLAALAVVAIAEPVLLLAVSPERAERVRGGRAGGPGRRRGRGGGAVAAPDRDAGRRPRMIARIVVVAAAVAGLVVLTGDLRVARDVERAAALTRAAERRERAEAARLLRGAAARTADTTPLLRAGQLELFLQRPERALGPARDGRRARAGERAGVAAARAGGRRPGDAALEARARRRVAELVASAP